MSHTITDMTSPWCHICHCVPLCHVPCVKHIEHRIARNIQVQNLKRFPLSVYWLHEFSSTLQQRPNNVWASEQEKESVWEKGILSQWKCLTVEIGQNTHRNTFQNKSSFKYRNYFRQDSYVIRNYLPKSSRMDKRKYMVHSLYGSHMRSEMKHKNDLSLDKSSTWQLQNNTFGACKWVCIHTFVEFNLY